MIIHEREALTDTLDILRSFCGRVHGVFHCFSNSLETARIVLDLGYDIALGGTVTFKNANKPREAAKAVPLDRLLIETDSPYLAPTPYRGKRNSSLYLPEVITMLSELHGVSYEEIEKITFENGKKLFNISE